MMSCRLLFTWHSEWLPPYRRKISRPQTLHGVEGGRADHVGCMHCPAVKAADGHAPCSAVHFWSWTKGISGRGTYAPEGLHL